MHLFCYLKKKYTHLEGHSNTDSCLYLSDPWHLYIDIRQLRETFCKVARIEKYIQMFDIK